MKRPAISVVIPTHNRKVSLLRLLRTLRDDTFPSERFEVRVVADGCTDDTVEALRAEPLPFTVQVLEQTPGLGAAAARNLGAAHARGELLVFLDDDMEPGPGLLAEHQRMHAELGVPAMVIGPPMAVHRPGANWSTIALWDWWEERFAAMRQPGHRFTYDNVFSSNLSIPAALFSQVGGFDVELKARHDYELGLKVIRCGGRTAFAPTAIAWHHESRSYRGLVKRKVEEGRGDVRLARLYPELWPVLPISGAEPSQWTVIGLGRRLAFGAPWLGDLLAGGSRWALGLLELLRRRDSWRKLEDGLTSYWYWRGVALSVGSHRALEALRATRAASAAWPFTLIDIDLREGLEAAEQRLDAERPDGVRLRYGSLRVGRIPPHPGAEPLRGAHLRALLATELAESLLDAPGVGAAGVDPVAPGLQAPVAQEPSGPAVVLPSVSVVVPAFNAGETIAETLESLVAQTYTRWEAIVVDDGSSDDTAAVAQRHVDRDSRIRLIRQKHLGVGAARNAGIAHARHNWLLFLDAHDWLRPRALELLARAVVADGTLDAVHGGWAQVADNGIPMDPQFGPNTGDLFQFFANFRAFEIHACLVRREHVERVGGFDPTLRTCEDWDLWQRVARSGTRFGRVSEIVAHYRVRRPSSATDDERFLHDGLSVIQRGHEHDPRVPDPLHVGGATQFELSSSRFRFAARVAILFVSRGEDPQRVLDVVAGERAPDLDPHDLAEQIFRTVPLVDAGSSREWDDLWPRVRNDVQDFLEVLETRSGASRLARRAGIALERLTIDASRLPRPFTRGATLAVQV